MKSPVSLPVALAVVGASLFPRVVAGQPAPQEPIPLVEIYGTLVPFLEYGHTKGATAPGRYMPTGATGTLTNGPNQVATAAYTGINQPSRGVLDPSTSNIGFRGGVELMSNLSVIWQVESAVPVDGTGPANTWASRNSNIGITGSWGTLFFGSWDTPYAWTTRSLVNPIRSGNLSDYNSIINNPGFGVSSVTTQSTRANAAADAAFERRQGNAVQYWTPNLAGFSARFGYSVNEGRTAAPAPTPTPTASPPSPSPIVASAGVSFEYGPITLREGVEVHYDYFGMSFQGGAPAAAGTNRSSTDFGAKTVAQFLNKASGFDTRVIGVAEYLSYKNRDNAVPNTVTPVMNANVEHARWAFYGLLDQTLFGKHHFWVGGGKAMEGTCAKLGGSACSTTGLSAIDTVVGYIYRASKSTDFWVAGYRIKNDFAASYTTSPSLGTAPPAPGATVEAFGVGILYTFSAKIIGPPTKPAPPPGPVPAVTPTPAPTNEPGPVPPPNAAEPPPNVGTPPPPTPDAPPPPTPRS
jgi:predicted porin